MVGLRLTENHTSGYLRFHSFNHYFFENCTLPTFSQSTSVSLGMPLICSTPRWSQLLVTLQARLSRWIYSPPHLFSGIRCDKGVQTHHSPLGKPRRNLPQFPFHAFLTSSANVELSRSIRKFPRALPYYYIIVKN